MNYNVIAGLIRNPLELPVIAGLTRNPLELPVIAGLTRNPQIFIYKLIK